MYNQTKQSMRQIIQDLLKKSGKQAEVNYSGKDRRVSFDESFGKHKVDAIKAALGDEANRERVLRQIAK